MKTALVFLALTFVSQYTFAFESVKCSNYFHTKSLHLDILEAKKTLQEKILGQEDLIDKTFIALLSNGHLLLSGPTGVAKTRLVNTLAKLFDGVFKKEQFTIDTSPTDLKGQEIYNREKGEYELLEGILFGNFILVDEINRAQPKTQNATLSAMEEREISINGRPRKLPDVYFLIATQNPEVHAGTFPLPDAQLDRFLFRINVDYTDIKTEKAISRLALSEMGHFRTTDTKNEKTFSLDIIRAARNDALKIPISENVEDYILAIVDATRNTHDYDPSGIIKKYIENGVGPRATIGLSIAAKSTAWMRGHSEVTIEDVDFILHDVLRHRLKLNRAAQVEGVTTDKIINDIQTIVKEKLNP